MDSTQKGQTQLQKAIIRMQKRYGKNILLKYNDFQAGATTQERNGQIGWHRAN